MTNIEIIDEIRAKLENNEHIPPAPRGAITRIA